MSRETEFGYGFLFAGAGLPYLIDKLMGPVPAVIAAAILFIIGILFLVAAHLHHKATQRKGLMYTIGTFTIIGAASGALIGSIAGAIAHTKPTQETIAIESDAAIQLSLTCDLIPLPVPYHAEIWELETAVFFEGLARHTSNPLEPDGFWPSKEAGGDSGYRCVIQNYGSLPLFSVMMPLDVTVMDVVEDKNGIRSSGKVTKKTSATIIVPHPLGPREAFTFYIANYYPEKSIEIRLPSSAAIDKDGTGAKTTIPLRVSSTVGNTLGLISSRRSSR